MTAQLLAAAASVALIGSGVAGASGVRSFEAMGMTTAVAAGQGAGDVGMCRVDVVRSGQSGTVSSTRQIMKDGGCVCTLVTGPAAANGNAEDVISSMLRDRTCPESPMVGESVGEVASAGGAGGGTSGLIIPVLVGVVAAAGLAVALGADSRG